MFKFPNKIFKPNICADAEYYVKCHYDIPEYEFYGEFKIAACTIYQDSVGGEIALCADVGHKVKRKF